MPTNEKISQLTAATTPTAADQIPLARAAANFSITPPVLFGGGAAGHLVVYAAGGLLADSGVTPSAAGYAILSAADAPAQRTALGLGTAATANSTDFDAAGAAAGAISTANAYTVSTLAAWTGSANVVTVGTVTAGTWTAAVISPAYGGTGVNNGTRTLTITSNGGTIGFSAAGLTLTVAANASVSGTNTGDQFTATTDGRLLGRAAGSNGAAGEIAVAPTLRLSSGVLYTDKPATALGTTGAVTVDRGVSNEFLLAPTGNVTLSLSNDYDGAGLTIYIRPSAFSVTWWAGIKWTGGAAPTPPTVAGHLTAVGIKRIASGEYWGTAAPEAY